MQIALIADTFPPQRTSGAVQLRDLSQEFAQQGHKITIMLPAPGLVRPWQLEDLYGAQILRLRAPRTKDIGYARRTLAELAMPLAMLRNLRKSPLATQKWDGVIWYAPSIFHGPLAHALKNANRCKGYLIIRDIFPEWAADLGLMKRSLPFYFFSVIARYQYSVADVIGIQTPGNRTYFERWRQKPGRRLEVLQNWLGGSVQGSCSINAADTRLAGRKLFVYAGNMGVAQRVEIILDLAKSMILRSDVGFLLVGRGSDAKRLKAIAERRSLHNVLFFDEIPPDEIPALYSQCVAGIVTLDPRHKSHNIPGKFLTYMQSGLPVLASVNTGNDLAELIRNKRVGRVCEYNKSDDFFRHATELLAQLDTDLDISERCRKLFEANFSVRKAVLQIISALSDSDS